MERLTIHPEEVLNIPREDLPLMVFSDNIRSFFSWGIKAHEHGCYNHFMWMIEPEKVISQDWIFHEVPLDKYLNSKHRLKFVRGFKWDFVKKSRIRIALGSLLRRPWYKKLYDPIQIVGKAVGCDWLQIPGLNICSDYGIVLQDVDVDFDLKHPSPTEINQYTKSRPDKYEAYLRFIPD